MVSLMVSDAGTDAYLGRNLSGRFAKHGGSALDVVRFLRFQVLIGAMVHLMPEHEAVKRSG
jgi:hypothetical protein